MLCRYSIHIGFTEKNQGVNQAMVTDILEDLYQEALHCQKEKGRVIRRQLDPSRSFRKKVRERNGTAGRGHPKARAQEAKHVHSHTMTKAEERARETHDSEHESAKTPTALSKTRCRQQDWNKPFRTRRSASLSQIQDRNCDYLHPPLRAFHRSGQCRTGFEMSLPQISKGDQAPIPKRGPK